MVVWNTWKGKCSKAPASFEIVGILFSSVDWWLHTTLGHHWCHVCDSLQLSFLAQNFWWTLILHVWSFSEFKGTGLIHFYYLLPFRWHFLCNDKFGVHNVFSLRLIWMIHLLYSPPILRVLLQNRKIKKPNLSCCWRRETRATRLGSCATWRERMLRFPPSCMSSLQGFWKPRKTKKPEGLFVPILRLLGFASKPVTFFFFFYIIKIHSKVHRWAVYSLMNCYRCVHPWGPPPNS